MREYFRTQQWLPFSRDTVFAFFANPAHLPPLMPRWQRARIDDATLMPPPARPAGSTTLPGVVAGSGTRLLITARAAPGVPLRTPWLALIEDFDWNDHFCDVQVRGPFAFWRHCHSVRDEERFGQTGTVVTDAVEYELPMAPISGFAAPVGRAAMRAMFGYRQRQAAVQVAAFAARLRLLPRA